MLATAQFESHLGETIIRSYNENTVDVCNGTFDVDSLHCDVIRKCSEANDASRVNDGVNTLERLGDVLGTSAVTRYVP